MLHCPLVLHFVIGINECSLFSFYIHLYFCPPFQFTAPWDGRFMWTMYASYMSYYAIYLIVIHTAYAIYVYKICIRLIYWCPNHFENAWGKLIGEKTRTKILEMAEKWSNTGSNKQNHNRNFQVETTRMRHAKSIFFEMHFPFAMNRLPWCAGTSIH